jgi:predicted SnoaL-like aldol condensation-catalyzing enzyme
MEEPLTAQNSLPREPPTEQAKVNAFGIASLYTAIQNGDVNAIAAFYDEHAYFQDIAFRRRGKREIMEMWRYVCRGKPQVTFDSSAILADNRKGSGRWRVKYVFGKTDTKPGRPVDNSISSAFAFNDGLIIEHRDRCDAMEWARQALPFPISLAVGSIGPLRRFMAGRKLHKFIKEEGS